MMWGLWVLRQTVFIEKDIYIDIHVDKMKKKRYNSTNLPSDSVREKTPKKQEIPGPYQRALKPGWC